MNQKNIFEKENDEFLFYILDKLFFNKWKNHDTYDKKTLPDFEIFVTSNCNLKCKYCYLNKSGELLYPSEYRDEENILNNLKILLDWVIDNKFCVNKFSIFSGEILHTDFGIKVLSIILEYLKKYKFTHIISIPTNGTFINNNKDFIGHFIKECEKLQVFVNISFSIDGYYLEDEVRGLKSNIKRDLDKFYNDVFEFSKKYYPHCGFHPMISYEGIKEWKENYKWFSEKLNQYDLQKANNLMMLEVRNDGWNEESLKEYKEFLYYMLYYQYNNIYNKEKLPMALHLLSEDSDNNYIQTIKTGKHMITCSIQRSFNVRCGDLAIIPCHRLSYNNLNYGKFITNGDKIIGIKSNNPEFALRVLTTNPVTNTLLCEKCTYKNICHHGCLGSQYEYLSEPFCPIPSVCKMMILKSNTIIDFMDSNGLLDEINNHIKDNHTSKTKAIKETIEEINKIINSIEYKDFKDGQ